MTWIVIGIIAIVGFVVYKLLIKPLFKVLLVVALALVIWHLLTNSL